MTTFQILMVIFVGLAVVGGLTGLIIYLTRRNNQQNNNNQQPNTNLCNGPIPVPNSNVHIPEQNLPLTTYLSICNRRNPWPWIVASILGVLFVLFLILFLTSAPSTVKNNTTEDAITQIVPPPAPLPVPQFPNDYAKKADIDSATVEIKGAITKHDNNLNAHRESSKRGYSAAKKQREEILNAVKENGGKLDGVKNVVDENKARLAQIQVKIDLLIPEIDSTRTQYENAIKSGNEDLKNYWRDELKKLNNKLENLLNGDPD